MVQCTYPWLWLWFWLTISKVVWISIFQYCFIRPFFTIVAVVAQTQGRYCSSSKDPRYAYIWVAGFEAVSVTIAMFCLVQFYIQLKEDLAPHRPFLKVLCIKLVIFFCFWQSWIISLLTAEGGPLKATEQIAGPDLRIGIPSMLTCVEMAIFAIIHLWAFPWKPYDLKRQNPLDTTIDGYSAHPTKYAYGPARALLDAINPWDIVKACGRGFRWLFHGARHRKNDPSYQTKMEPVTTNTSYNGPTFAGNGEPINEPATSKKNERFGDSDTTGLLSDAQANPYMQQGSSPYDGTYGPGSDAYGSHSNPDRLPQAPTPGQEYGLGHRGNEDGKFQDFEHQDTAYTGGAAANSYYERPRYYQENAARPNTEWDMFAGATRPAERPQGDGSQPSKWI